MLDLQGLLALLNDKEFKPGGQPEVKKWRDVYYRMSVHIDGACPRFYHVGRPVDGITTGTNSQWVTPYNYYGPEYQEIFDLYLINRHRRENELTRQFRLSQYKPFTQRPFQQVIQVVTGAIFQDSNYSIVVQDKEDNDYIWGPNFEGQSLPAYFSSSFQDICNDPNGLFVVRPSQPWYETAGPNVAPIIRFIPSKKVVYNSPAEVIYDDGPYRWAVNAIGYFRFKRGSDGNTWVEADGNRGFYAHMLGYIPAFVAGGQWNSQGFYESHLNAARAFADEYVSAKSAKQLVDKEASHPWITMASEDCPECQGVGKFSKCSLHKTTDCGCGAEGQWALEVCSVCGGSGEMSRNPADILLAPPEEMDRDLVKVTNPDTAINEYHAKDTKELFEDLMASLHLHYIDEAQSGTAKDKDMETRYQFILNISNDLFDRLIEGALKVILALRNVRVTGGQTMPAVTEYNIDKPTQFAIETATDLLEQLKASTQAGTPSFIRAEQLRNYQDKQFGGNDIMRIKTDFILQSDPLAVKSASEQSALVMAGAFDLRDIQYSARLSAMIDKVIRDQGAEWFKKATYEQIKLAVDTIFAGVKPPIPEITTDDPGQV